MRDDGVCCWKPRSSLLSVSSACMWRTLGVAVLLFPAISQPFSRALDTGLGNLQAHKRCPSWPSRLVQTKTLDPNAPLTALLLLRGGGGGSEEHSGASEDGVRAGGGQGPSMWEEEVVQSSKEDDGGSPAKREAKTTEDAEVAVSTEEEEAGTGKAEAEAEAEAEHAAATEEEDSTPSDEGTVSVTASGAKRGRRAAAADGITAGKTPRRGGRGGRSAARAAGAGEVREEEGVACQEVGAAAARGRGGKRSAAPRAARGGKKSAASAAAAVSTADSAPSSRQLVPSDALRKEKRKPLNQMSTHERKTEMIFRQQAQEAVAAVADFTYERLALPDLPPPATNKADPRFRPLQPRAITKQMAKTQTSVITSPGARVSGLARKEVAVGQSASAGATGATSTNSSPVKSTQFVKQHAALRKRVPVNQGLSRARLIGPAEERVLHPYNPTAGQDEWGGGEGHGIRKFDPFDPALAKGSAAWTEETGRAPGEEEAEEEEDGTERSVCAAGSEVQASD